MIENTAGIYQIVRLVDIFELAYVGLLCIVLAIKIRRESAFGWSIGFFLLTIGALFGYGAVTRSASAVTRLDLGAMAIRAVLALAATVACVAVIRRLRGSA